MAKHALKLHLLLSALFLSACHPDPDRPDPASDPFQLRRNTGIGFQNTITESYETFFEFFPYIYNGGGVAAGDINNDGLADLYFTGNQVPDKLYLNKGNFTFEDISTSSGIAQHKGWCNGVSMSDVNQDGWLDIYISRGGWNDSPGERANLLYINNHDGTFTEKAREYSLDDDGYSMQAVFFDMDNDNDLDMYLANRPEAFNLPLTVMRDRSANPPDLSRDKLYLNDGTNHFSEVALERGIKNYGYSLGVVAGDINDDGWADIFVANDFATPDLLYINLGNGYFENKIDSAMNHISLFSMGVDLADFNNDLMEDFIVMEMRPDDYVRSKVSMPSMDVEGFKAIVEAGMHKQYMHNMLHMNQGRMRFSEISQLCGVAKTDWSWAPLFYDLNNDGRKDLFVTNGIRRDFFDGDAQMRLKKYIEDNRDKFRSPQELFGKGFPGIMDCYYPIKLPNYLYINKDNFEFEQLTTSPALSENSFSNGSVVADLDNDGDLDIVTNNIDAAASVLENTGNNGNWLKIKLAGPKNNLFGIGAKVYVHSASGVQYFQQKTSRGYLSSQDPVIHTGLGPLNSVDSVVVIWPDKKQSVKRKIPANSTVEITYQSSRQLASAGVDDKFFTDVTDQTLDKTYVHQENLVNEFKEQVLLPHEFSKSGPKVAVADINNDGRDDFYVCGSRGHAGRLYLSSKQNKWADNNISAFQEDKKYEDSGALFFDYDNDGDPDLFVASGGSDLPEGDILYQNRLYRNNDGNFTRVDFPKAAHNSSAVLSHDFDQDGDEDLFVGGFVKTNRYPQADKTSFFRNDGNLFEDVTEEWLADIEMGIVFDATLTDLNQDQKKELAVVGEWMPVTILSFEGNRFQNHTGKYGLASTVGWWNAVSAADLDGDGDEDLIAGNLGENYKFKANNKNEFGVYADDFDSNGTFDVFLANKKDDKLLPVRGKECSSQQMPVINNKFPSFTAFAHAELDEILGEKINSCTHFEVNLLSSVILENKNGVLSSVALPKEAQFSTVNSIIAEDFDHDGKVDILLGGNRFESEVETTPSDASLGLLMLNKGNLQFEPVPAGKSGLYLSGNVKDISLITAGQSKKYLISSENQGPLRIFTFN